MKKDILILIGIFFILSILSIVVFAQSGDNTGVSVTILEVPMIFLGDDEHGNDTIDNDYEIWATLTTDSQVKNCEINWDEGWQIIDKTITSISHIYLSEGTKTIYYQCYDDNDNCITVDDSILIQLIITCLIDADCDDSDPYTEDVCDNPGTVDSYCDYLSITCLTNTDCDDDDDYTEDICNNPGTPESSCSNLPMVCLVDDDCDDSDPYTEDVCENPGTDDSYCSYLSIICLTNSDCGTDGYIENPFCQNDDVWQDYITYTCNDPGISAASCSDSTVPELIEDCTNGCTEGRCKIEVCKTICNFGACYEYCVWQ